MESLNKVKDCLIRNGFGAMIDLEDAFYHINVRQKDMLFLRFMMFYKIYIFPFTSNGTYRQPQNIYIVG